MIVSVATFTQASSRRSEVAFYALLAGYFGTKCFNTMGFVFVYQYASEIYPTNARVAGAALCLAAGRLGSIIAPIAFVYSNEVYGTWAGFFHLMVAICLLNAVLIIFLPF